MEDLLDDGIAIDGEIESHADARVREEPIPAAGVEGILGPPVEVQTAVELLRAADDLHAVLPLDAVVLARDPAVKIVSSPQKLHCRLYLGGRTKDAFVSGGRDGLFTDTRVRMAFNLAINRDAIIKKVFHGYALANASPGSRVSHGYAAQEL